MARILIVDDEYNIRMMMRLALQHVGHEVRLAADGPEGLRTFGNGDDFDLVLLDQRMPGMEGLAVLKEIRTRDSRAKIVMVTAFGTIDLAVEAMKAGAKDFLRKPFTAEVLRGAVQSVLQQANGDDAAQAGDSITFGSTTINGYRIEYQANTARRSEGDFRQPFVLRSPEGLVQQITVVLPVSLQERVREQADRERLSGSDRFWTALCEEALANYLWQNAEIPEEPVLTVEELTTGLRRFIEQALSA